MASILSRPQYVKQTYASLLHMCDSNHTIKAISNATSNVHTPVLMAFMTYSYHKQLMTLSCFPKFQQSVANQFHQNDKPS